MGERDPVLHRPQGAAAGRERPDGWDTALTELDQELTDGFPALVRDQNFISLVEELVQLPEPRT
ncbi:hypothetical protein [Streptomyces sp. H27-D2]|uniref:hypothetical protein n=1 Tax=Streptomyces sp. H27-D2 TaxID=3046304 RepID=UPI002DBB9D36|nr:hypothetical protein [Streptomyces sp. H27-D2]MEC4017153.1 hypothetical protein [Streptomyces sp. H27-D2]